MSNISGVSGGSAPTPSQSDVSNKPADSKDADDFSNAMEKKEGGEKKKAEHGKEEKSPHDLMRSVRDSLEGMEGKTEKIQMAKTDTAAAIQKTSAAESADKINKIVDRIMVAEASATKEVKVSFNQDFLAGTDVTIRKDGGKISIDFSTSSAESFSFLTKGEQTLANQLQNKLGDNVSVDIKMQGSEMDQQQDGRSRNEFISDDEADD